MIEELFKAIDSKDADKFVLFLTEDARFRFANMPQISGRDNIRSEVSQFFSSVKSMNHRILKTWDTEEVIICEGEVTYTRLDDSQITFPFANIFRMKEGLITDYRIYVDASALYHKS
jgi:limonene-1,2-epoxide hydrolase